MILRRFAAPPGTAHAGTIARLNLASPKPGETFRRRRLRLLAGPLGFTPTGGLALVIVLLAAVFAFGLSTDYEVFLFSAVMAARHEGHDTDTAVTTGIARTARIITLAAVLIVVVFIGFAARDLLIITQLGIGLAIAVLLDATLIRLALIPALMTLLKERNWTGPRLARRASQRLWNHEAPA